MDLISREAAIEAVKVPNGGYSNPSERHGIIIARVEARRRIMEIPSVHAIPAVHGKWMEYKYDEREYRRIIVPYDGKGIPHDIFCSECGTPALLNGHEEDVASKYCPHCGAKMDVEGEE